MPEPGKDAGAPFVAADGTRIEVLYDSEAIGARIDALARAIAGNSDGPVLAVPILTGSFIFAADLIRALHGVGMIPQVDFLSLASYGSGTTSSGRIRVLRDVEVDVSGRDVLLVDDILDTGRTLLFARNLLAEREASRVLSCVLLDKKASRAVPVDADYAGFDCPDDFVVGYGMDLDHRFRELPFVGRIV